MKKLVGLLMIIFLVGFICAGMTSKAVYNNKESDNNSEIKTQTRTLTEEQIKNIITTRNRIRITAEAGECPEGCTCTGNVTKCQLRNRTEEMTIVAGDSGNMIMQVKGVNVSTNISLYKAEDGNLYGVFKDNETKEIKILPDQIQERIREKLARTLENEDITLNEDGTYNYQAEKRARLFLIFLVRVKVNAELDPETGEVISLKNSWWSFLAKDEIEEENE